MEVAVLATLTYSNVASQGQKRLLEVDSRVCFLHGVTFLRGRGKRAVSYTHLTLPTNREV